MCIENGTRLGELARKWRHFEWTWSMYTWKPSMSVSILIIRHKIRFYASDMNSKFSDSFSRQRHFLCRPNRRARINHAVPSGSLSLRLSCPKWEPCERNCMASGTKKNGARKSSKFVVFCFTAPALQSSNSVFQLLFATFQYAPRQTDISNTDYLGPGTKHRT